MSRKEIPRSRSPIECALGVVEVLDFVVERDRSNACDSRILPPSMSSTPNSPTVWAKLKAIPAPIPRRAIGSVRYQNTCRKLAPEICATSTSVWNRLESGLKGLHDKMQTLDDRTHQKSAKLKARSVAG